MADKPRLSPATEALLLGVQSIRSRIPAWMRALVAAEGEATDQTPDYEKLRRLLEDPGSSAPREAARKLRSEGENTDESPDALVGEHAVLLEGALNEAGKRWQSAADAVVRSEAANVLSGVQSAVAALDAAMQHALFLTFANDVRKGKTGESRGIDAYCRGWGLSSDDIDALWWWLQQDPLEFDGEELPIALDTVNRCAYRKTTSGLCRVATAMTPLWGAAFAFGLIALLFEVLHLAGLTSWPGRWGWKMLVLFAFVAMGALVHVGARALNVNYDDPMKVYDAGGLLDWLSLRWIAMLKMYMPVTFVAASLWGAGSVPTSFQQLGTAILAGYSADSAVRTTLSTLQARAAGSRCGYSRS